MRRSAYPRKNLHDYRTTVVRLFAMAEAREILVPQIRLAYRTVDLFNARPIPDAFIAEALATLERRMRREDRDLEHIGCESHHGPERSTRGPGGGPASGSPAAPRRWPRP